jgi:hypothetical protein
MTGTAKVYALLVGIDRYRLPHLDLQGCVNDIKLAERLLSDRIEPANLAVEKLCDEQATRPAGRRGGVQLGSVHPAARQGVRAET